MDSAIELFAKKGFGATSIQEITENCGISKGAFYLSFKSKDELFLAIIDQVIDKFSNSIDQVVNGTVDNEHKLFLYYRSILEFLNSHRDFAMIFISEQMHSGPWDSMNKKVFNKLSLHEEQFSYSIISFLEQIYGEQIKDTKYDLMFCIKGFIHIYSEYVLFQQHSVDIASLSTMLVEKTNALAKYTKTSFLTKQTFHVRRFKDDYEITQELILKTIEQHLIDSDVPLERESLQLLKEQLLSNQPSEAIIRGMINNLKQFPNSRQLINLYMHLEYKQLYCKA